MRNHCFVLFYQKVVCPLLHHTPKSVNTYKTLKEVKSNSKVPTNISVVGTSYLYLFPSVRMTNNTISIMRRNLIPHPYERRMIFTKSKRFHSNV